MMGGYDRDHRGLMRGLPVEPRRYDDDLDPNFRGGRYHGQRMRQGRESQAAYGRHRLYHREDLGRFGGFEGRYSAGPGRMDGEGLYREPFDEEPGRYARTRFGPTREDWERVERSGVNPELRYLRDYNAHSPELREGDNRSFGYAGGEPGARPGEGPWTRDRFSRAANRYGTREGPGFAEGWLPRQAGRGSHADRA